MSAARSWLRYLESIARKLLGSASDCQAIVLQSSEVVAGDGADVRRCLGIGAGLAGLVDGAPDDFQEIAGEALRRSRCLPGARLPEHRLRQWIHYTRGRRAGRVGVEIVGQEAETPFLALDAVLHFCDPSDAVRLEFLDGNRNVGTAVERVATARAAGGVFAGVMHGRDDAIEMPLDEAAAADKAAHILRAVLVAFAHAPRHGVEADRARHAQRLGSEKVVDLTQENRQIGFSTI